MQIAGKRIGMTKVPVLAVFCIGVVAGILVMYMGKSVLLKDTGLFDEDTLYHMKYMTVDGRAAIIDDILGIIALTIVTSCADASVNVSMVLGKIVLFFVFAIGAGIIFYRVYSHWVKGYHKDMRRFVIIAFVFCLLLSFCAEEFFGVADITGAFIAGLILSNSPCVPYITSRFEIISYMLLSPIFFASIGIQVDLTGMNHEFFWFTILLVVIAIVSKIIGCGLGARMCHYSKEESLQIGVGMVSRGEVALIVASKGAAVGLMGTAFFAPVVLMVVVTTVMTPIFLNWVFKPKHRRHK